MLICFDGAKVTHKRKNRCRPFWVRILSSLPEFLHTLINVVDTIKFCCFIVELFSAYNRQYYKWNEIKCIVVGKWN